MVIPPEGMSPSEVEAYTEAVYRQRQFEEWAADQGFPLTPAPGMYCADGKFPACYLNAGTEGAWRAWACKDHWMEKKGYKDGKST